jgi:3-hydroxyisobutyrate dehydrogenase
MARDSKPTVAFVGVGRMGANMALRLRDVGYSVTAVYDVYPESAKTVAREIGARAVTQLAEVTRSADVIITVVSDDAAMFTIFAESGDSLLEASAGKIFVNCATVTPSVHVEVDKRARARGAESIEASMASSITQAREGTLYLMVGGERRTYDKVEAMLQKMSATLRYIGPAGTAAQVKALVNMVMNINTAGLAEGLGVGDALGLDLTMLRDVFSQTGANSRVLETDGLDMQKRDHEVYFSAAHAAKDSHIAISLGTAAGLELPVAQASAAQFDRMVELGIGDDHDKSGVAELTFLSRRGAHAHAHAAP